MNGSVVTVVVAVMIGTAVVATTSVFGHVTRSLVLLVHHTRQIHLVCVSCSLNRVVECSINLGQSK